MSNSSRWRRTRFAKKNASGNASAIEVIVTRLRRKIGGASIENRRGYGYLLADAKP